MAKREWVPMDQDPAVRLPNLLDELESILNDDWTSSESAKVPPDRARSIVRISSTWRAIRSQAHTLGQALVEESGGRLELEGQPELRIVQAERDPQR